MIPTDELSVIPHSVFVPLPRKEMRKKWLQNADMIAMTNDLKSVNNLFELNSTYNIVKLTESDWIANGVDFQQFYVVFFILYFARRGVKVIIIKYCVCIWCIYNYHNIVWKKLYIYKVHGF